MNSEIKSIEIKDEICCICLDRSGEELNNLTFEKKCRCRPPICRECQPRLLRCPYCLIGEPIDNYDNEDDRRCLSFCRLLLIFSLYSLGWIFLIHSAVHEQLTIIEKIFIGYYIIRSLFGLLHSCVLTRNWYDPSASLGICYFIMQSGFEYFCVLMLLEPSPIYFKIGVVSSSILCIFKGVFYRYLGYRQYFEN